MHVLSVNSFSCTRESSDDGIATGLLMGPFIASAALISSLRAHDLWEVLPPSNWLIEPPFVLHKMTSAMQALTLSRHSLLNLATYCSTILLLNVTASWWLEGKYAEAANTADGERASVPRGEGRRFSMYALFTLAISVFMVCLKAFLEYSGLGIWRGRVHFIPVPVTQALIHGKRPPLLRSCNHSSILQSNIVCRPQVSSPWFHSG